MDPDDVRNFRVNVDVLSKINGFKNKQPLICESFSRKNVRKSIVAKNDIKKGERIDKTDLEFKMPEKGISPNEIENVIGKIANLDIKKGSFIDYEMLS